MNNKAGSFFAPYEFYYAWRKTDGERLDREGRDQFALLDDPGAVSPDAADRCHPELCLSAGHLAQGGEDPLPLPAILRGDEAVSEHPAAHEAGRRWQGRHLLWGDGLRQELHHVVPGAAC